MTPASKKTGIHAGDKRSAGQALSPDKSTAAAADRGSIAAEIDELGALERECAPLKPKLERIEQLRKTIRAHFDASPPALEFQAAGDKFGCLIGARANERTINPERLIKAIGLKAYASIARVTLKALDTATHPNAVAVIAHCVTTAATGARPLKTFSRA